jgi:hypothetical protein
MGMGIGLGGIVPTRIAIGAIESSSGQALPKDVRGRLTHGPDAVGQPAPAGAADIFGIAPAAVIFGPSPGDFGESIGEGVAGAGTRGRNSSRNHSSRPGRWWP